MPRIQDILDEYRIPYDVSGRGKNRPNWLNIKCPQCQKWPYLGINLRKLYANCWTCGYIPLMTVLCDLTGMSRAHAKTLIGELPSEKIGRKQHTGKLIYPPDVQECLLATQEKYLRGRGFDPLKLQQLWGLRGIGGLGGKMAWRILIPITQDSKVVSWTTRRITDKEPRYVSARADQSAVPIEDCIYGIDYCRNGVVLVEGPADTWRIGPGAAALLGLRVSPVQLEQLAGIPNRVICFDSERPAQERARRLMRELSVLDGKTVNVVLDSKDPGSASEQEIAELRRNFL